MAVLAGLVKALEALAIATALAIPALVAWANTLWGG